MERSVNKLAKKLGLKKKMFWKLCLPEIGTKFFIEGIEYEVVYVRSKPFRFSAKPVDTVKREDWNFKKNRKYNWLERVIQRVISKQARV